MARTLKRRHVSALESAGFDSRRIARKTRRERDLAIKRDRRRETESARREDSATLPVPESWQWLAL